MARTTKKIIGIPGQSAARPTPYRSLPEQFWTDAAKILGKMLSPDFRKKIDRATEIYTFEMDNSVSALTIANACARLVKAMDQFRHAYDSALTDPETGAHIKKMVTDDLARGVIERPNWFDEQWWGQFEGVRERVLDEKEECTESPDNKPWNDWVRRLASILRMEGFAVTTRNYESRDDQRTPTQFVEFVTRLQAELSESYAQHEPTRAGHPYFAIDKAIQRALRLKRPTG